MQRIWATDDLEVLRCPLDGCHYRIYRAFEFRIAVTSGDAGARGTDGYGIGGFAYCMLLIAEAREAAQKEAA
jgi:hypothetical protein